MLRHAIAPAMLRVRCLMMRAAAEATACMPPRCATRASQMRGGCHAVSRCAATHADAYARGMPFDYAARFAKHMPTDYVMRCRLR